jgi:hypothetical protein
VSVLGLVVVFVAVVLIPILTVLALNRFRGELGNMDQTPSDMRRADDGLDKNAAGGPAMTWLWPPK